MTLRELVVAFDAVRPLEVMPLVEVRRAWREAAGVSLELAAAVMGVAVRSVSEWERGVREPRLAHRAKYLKFLAVAGSTSGKALA